MGAPDWVDVFPIKKKGFSSQLCDRLPGRVPLKESHQGWGEDVSVCTSPVPPNQQNNNQQTPQVRRGGFRFSTDF